MKSLTSGFSFVVQAILVVAGVLVFAYLDPFDIFVSTKLKLKDTPAHIREIRAIGELISAEYYGEVISSYQSIVHIQAAEEITRTKNKLVIMDSLFLQQLKKISSVPDKKRREELLDSIRSAFGKEDHFDDYFHAVKKKLHLNFLSSLVKQLLDPKNIDILLDQKDYLNDLQADQVSEITKVYSTRAVRKPQLIMLGRGKVQAGFRFDKLDARNMRIDTMRHRIVLFGIQPEILSCDINPWLVPKLGIKGFEIIEVNGKADDPAILYKVKKACLDSLRASALASDILNIAKTNAELNLQAFFSLILDDPGIEVRIESDLVSYYMKYLRRDTVINPSELESINRTIAECLNPPPPKKASAYDSLRAFTLLDTLKLCKFAVGQEIFQVNPFSLPVYQLLTNNKLNSKNKDSLNVVFLARLKTLQKNWNEYSLWFYQLAERKYSVSQGDTTDKIYRRYISQSDSLFRTTFNRVYPDTLKTNGRK